MLACAGNNASSSVHSEKVNVLYLRVFSQFITSSRKPEEYSARRRMRSDRRLKSGDEDGLWIALSLRSLSPSPRMKIFNGLDPVSLGHGDIIAPRQLIFFAYYLLVGEAGLLPNLIDVSFAYTIIGILKAREEANGLQRLNEQSRIIDLGMAIYCPYKACDCSTNASFESVKHLQLHVLHNHIVLKRQRLKLIVEKYPHVSVLQRPQIHGSCNVG